MKQGGHGQVVIFWKTIQKGDDLEQQGGEKKSISILRYYKVFNIAQCRDIPESLLPVQNEKEHDPIVECESIIAKMPQCPAIQHKVQKAFYDIEKDYINMPKKKTFATSESYYQTLFHELTHSTGHSKRLDRATINQMAEFGDDLYSTEELIAEFGACYLASFAGILSGEVSNSAAYIKGWLKKLKDDKKLIVFAASFAQRAVDFILNLPKVESQSKEEIEQPEVLIES